jgi:hypothetical protein
MLGEIRYLQCCAGNAAFMVCRKRGTKMRNVRTGISLLIAAWAAAAAGSPIDQVAEGLAEMAADMNPTASMRQDTRTVTLSYNARGFMVHSSDKLGRRSIETHKAVGPRHDGLIVRAALRDGRYEGPADIPKDVSSPYWTTFVNAYPVAKGTQHLRVSVLYGSSTDPVLVKEVKELLSSVKVSASTPAQTIKDYFFAAKAVDLQAVRSSVTQSFWEKNGEKMASDLADSDRGDASLLQHLTRIDIIDRQISAGEASIRYEVVLQVPEEAKEKSMSNTALLVRQGDRWLINDM